jgi:serine/threonine protein kinase
VQDEDGNEVCLWSLPWATRLIDFGLSKHGLNMEHPIDAKASIDVHSIPWMAPETFMSTQHKQASDVYSFGMVLWEILTTHKPPTTGIQTYIATGMAFVGATRTSPGPCEDGLAELLALQARGEDATLMRKLHGMPCPVLEPLVELIRATHRYSPQDRITAADAARELAKLEADCQNYPVGCVPKNSQEMARYWMETYNRSEEAEELRPFSSSSTLSTEVESSWTKYVSKIDSDD